MRVSLTRGDHGAFLADKVDSVLCPSTQPCDRTSAPVVSALLAIVSINFLLFSFFATVACSVCLASFQSLLPVETVRQFLSCFCAFCIDPNLSATVIDFTLDSSESFATLLHGFIFLPVDHGAERRLPNLPHILSLKVFCTVLLFRSSHVKVKIMLFIRLRIVSSL